MIVVDHTPNPHPLRLPLDTAAHFHLRSSTPGKVMLASLPEENLQNILARISYELFTCRR